MFEVKNNQITLTRGDTCALSINIVGSDEQEYTMQEGDVLTFTMKKKVESETIVLEKTFEDNILYLTSADTLGLDFGSYVYDVILTTLSNEVFTVIPTSTFFVAKEVHN